MPTRRRRVLASLSATVIVGIAGCLGTTRDGPEGSAGADDPDPANESDDPAGDLANRSDDRGDDPDGTDTDDRDGGNRSDGDGNDSDGSGDENGTDADDLEAVLADLDPAFDLGDPTDAAEIAMVSDHDGFRFAPPIVHVETGGTATWTIESGTHDTVAYHPENDRPRGIPDDAAPWASDVLDRPGDEFERVLEGEGVYDYFCQPHEKMGMVGRVVVGWPDPAAVERKTDARTELPERARSRLKAFDEATAAVLEAGPDE